MIDLKSLIRVFVSAQEMTGYDPYPVVHNQLMEPLSATVTDMTTISEHRVRIRDVRDQSRSRSRHWSRSRGTGTGTKIQFFTGPGLGPGPN